MTPKRIGSTKPTFIFYIRLRPPLQNRIAQDGVSSQEGGKDGRNAAIIGANLRCGCFHRTLAERRAVSGSL
jgi:hypothetical protein